MPHWDRYSFTFQLWPLLYISLIAKMKHTAKRQTLPPTQNYPKNTRIASSLRAYSGSRFTASRKDKCFMKQFLENSQRVECAWEAWRGERDVIAWVSPLHLMRWIIIHYISDPLKVGRLFLWPNYLLDTLLPFTKTSADSRLDPLEGIHSLSIINPPTYSLSFCHRN